MKSRQLLAALALLLVLPGCKKEETQIQHDPANVAREYRSEKVVMGNGYMYTWITCDNSCAPRSIGIALSSRALEGLSTDTGSAHSHPHDGVNVWQIPFPKQAIATPFVHAAINWNPTGHFPPPYSFPHFDFHFYTISSAEREQIPAFDEDSTGFKNFPAAAYFPANYIAAPGGEPQMGTHWVDVTSPELNGQQFTQTFVYGSYNGKVNFLEPMITLAFLKQTTLFERTIPRPSKVQVTGYYPTSMKVSRSFGEYRVCLDNMEYRVGS